MRLHLAATGIIVVCAWALVAAAVAAPRARSARPAGAGSPIRSSFPVAATNGAEIQPGETGELRPLIADGEVVQITTAPVVRLGRPGPLDGADIGVYLLRGGFVVGAGGYGAQGPGDSQTCLAQAIYFEARSESVAGQEAVAQVVMNRTRMGNHPHSVCGVVYEGSERRTGCQFTFTCDGSLRDPSDYVAWDRAETLAKQALGGFIYQPMAEATHYHASWMTPYWSGELTRIQQIGGHIFYR